MVAATMQVYKSAIRSFLPMPSKSHYVFNLRDFARVVRGVLLVPSSRMTEPDKMIRLWIHEVYRVFNDRLTDDADRSVDRSGCVAQLAERRSLAGELTLSCARPAADG